MKRDPTGRGPDDAKRELEEFFRDEMRLARAESPGFEELAAYVEGRLDPQASALLEERMEADATLRQEVEDLRTLRAQMARPRSTAPRQLAWRIGLLAAAAAAVFLWLRPSTVKAPGGPSVPPSPAPVAALKDGGLRLALSAGGALSGAPSLEPSLRDAVAAALRGALPAPPSLEALSGGGGTLMGAGPGPADFAPVSPLATRVLADQPTFRWTPHPRARAYEVAVFDSDLRRQLASGPVAAAEWRPAKALPRGRTYLWQVTALAGGERVTVPVPPAPEARFEVAGDAVLSEVDRRRASAPGSHLVAAIAFVEAGLLDDAEPELRALAADNPDSPEARRLLDALNRLRRRAEAPR